MKKLKPLRGIYYPKFIAANQKERADWCKKGNSKWAHVQQVRKDIRKFKEKNKCDKVIIMWSANTECFSKIVKG